MKYITISQHGTIYGWGACAPEAVDHIDPGPGRSLIVDVDPPSDPQVFWRYVDGVVVSTNQPVLPPSPELTWDDQAALWIDARTESEKYDAAATAVRDKRTNLLQASDWTDTASAPDRLGAAVYASWQGYRQQLRDVTSQSGFPFDVVWPTPPQ